MKSRAINWTENFWAHDQNTRGSKNGKNAAGPNKNKAHEGTVCERFINEYQKGGTGPGGQDAQKTRDVGVQQSPRMRGRAQACKQGKLIAGQKLKT